MKTLSHRELLCEFVGTMVWVFVVIGVTGVAQAPDTAIGTLGAALAIVLTIFRCWPMSWGPVRGSPERGRCARWNTKGSVVGL
jgi:glycerol uptake facilitator-like aquaporin